jgi:hypothetical protein
MSYILGSCLPNFAKEEYDFLWMSPPCYEDASFFGADIKRPETYKTEFFDNLVPMMNPRLGTVTVSFTGDRRNNSRVLPKFYYVIQSFFENGYYLRDVKYSAKSDTYNAYSSQVLHILTFQKEGVKGLYNLRKNSLYNTYGKDIWGPFGKELFVDGEVVGQPIEIAEYCIQNFTDEGHVVFDPFAGIGTTLAAARYLKRGYIGYEIRESIWAFGKNRYGL